MPRYRRSPGEDLVATVPEVSKYATVEVKNFANVPSDYMEPTLWTALSGDVSTALARPAVAGVIVSHGTDTLEETAYKAAAPGKPFVETLRRTE